MNTDVKILLARVDQRLEELGGKAGKKTRYWLSKMATDGKSTRVFIDIERKGYLPKEPRLRSIAEVLDVSVDWLLGRTDNPAPVRSEVALAESRLDWHGPPPDDRGLPVYGTGDCADLVVDTDEGQVRIDRSSFDPDYHVTYVERPAALRGDREAYAIYFHGDSMEPRFFAGECGIVQPSRPPAPGDFVVVQVTNGEGPDVVSVLVKRLVRQTASYVELEQYNPQMIFRIPRRQVARIHRIIETRN